MPTATVRISPETRSLLKEISNREKRSIQAILDTAVEEYRRRRFLQEANQAYARLREDAPAWEDELQERRHWDHTLADDLKD
jgi:predicted transcriptional regulator